MHQAAALARLNLRRRSLLLPEEMREHRYCESVHPNNRSEGQSLPALLAQDSGVHSISLFENEAL